MQKKILVVDDEEKILMVVKLYLEKNNYEVITSKNGFEALQLFTQYNPNLVILDLMLPDLSGEEICKKIREVSNVPIIMLTAKVEEENILTGFSIGADDYMIKPFSPKQLIARVNAVLRRVSETNTEYLFNNHELIIDEKSFNVNLKGENVTLTPIEFKILALLATHTNRVFSREDIIQEIYHDDFDGYDRAIDSHIKNIRKKLADNPPKYILTVHGLGYKFSGDGDV
ncbi:MAG: response regulator transcription factor [Haloplasmataceae bacterium]|nr:response regulator transcription factor [Haloplasmataceae bacterium]